MLGGAVIVRAAAPAIDDERHPAGRSSGQRFRGNAPPAPPTKPIACRAFGALTFRHVTVVILGFMAFGRPNVFAAEQSRNTDALQEGQIPREAEIACLENTMKRLETDLQPMIRRADLWSLGDIEGLRAMTIPDRDADCQGAFLAVPQLQNLASQADASTDNAWLAAADNALAHDVSSFAVLDIAELLQPNGLLAKLRDEGYAVEEPRTRNRNE